MSDACGKFTSRNSQGYGPLSTNITSVFHNSLCNNIYQISTCMCDIQKYLIGYMTRKSNFLNRGVYALYSDVNTFELSGNFL